MITKEFIYFTISSLTNFYLNDKKCQMPKQTMPKRIRRCLACNEKTHQRFWDSPECPLCHSAEGYIETAHGGLPEEEIRIRIKAIDEIERGTPGKERF